VRGEVLKEEDIYGNSDIKTELHQSEVIDADRRSKSPMPNTNININTNQSKI